MTPLVSFIVTYHNEPEAFVAACLESLRALSLTEEEAEIIVVDDGSEKPCLSGKGLRIIRQEQAGLSVARNTGISHATGKYIQFVDADDCLLPSAYEAVIDHLRKETADIILFRMTTKDRSHPVKECGWLKSSGQSYCLHHNLRAAAWGYAFRRSILGDLRFYPGLLHEDELFTPQLFLRANTLIELNVKAYFYRQHDGTITHSTSPEKVKKRLDDIHFTIKELHSLGNPLLERRIRQLTVDYLQKTWTQTHSLRELRCRVSELRKEGFLPLPLRRYSLRYLLASLVF